MKSNSIILMFYLLVFIIGIVSLWIPLNEGSNYSSENEFNLERDFKIGYQNLTNEEIMNINKLIDSLDPKYLSLQHQIIFKRNVTYKNLSFCNCSGINYNDGEEIEINYDENNAWLKIVICHELLHSFIKDIPLDLEEKLVRDISKTGVCYNTIKKRVSLEL